MMCPKITGYLTGAKAMPQVAHFTSHIYTFQQCYAGHRGEIPEAFRTDPSQFPYSLKCYHLNVMEGTSTTVPWGRGDGWTGAAPMVSVTFLGKNSGEPSREAEPGTDGSGEGAVWWLF